MAPWEDDTQILPDTTDDSVHVSVIVYITVMSTALVMAFIILCIKLGSLGNYGVRNIVKRFS